MAALISYLLVVLAGLLAVPVTVFVVEVLAAILLKPRERAADRLLPARPRLAVLVPAHNESTGLIPTIEDIKSQLRSGDTLLVVADNCSDDTASLARAAEAEVIERTDPQKLGKGYALDWGLRHLSADPPSVVVIIDADCRLSPNALDHLASACETTKRPAQSLDLMTTPAGGSINHRVAEFAWRVKNWVRPLGLRALGLPCQLMGTGMAFPWEVIRSANLATGHIVEDLKLGLDLALAGSPATFCPSAVVTSEFPSTAEAAVIQRQRWEQGHIGLILTSAPRMVGLALCRRQWAALALACDLLVPPFALLVLFVVILFAVSAFAGLLGASWTAFGISGLSLAALLVAVTSAWWHYGKELLPIGRFVELIPYLLTKLALYRRFLRNKGMIRWVRTDRKR